MSIVGNVQCLITAVETLATGVDQASNPVISHGDNLASTTQLSATTTPAVDEGSFIKHALTAGAKTIDFTALAGTNGRVIDATGKKLHAFCLINLGANAMTLTQGGSNPYLILGASGSAVIPAGGRLCMYLAGGAAAVSGTVKTILVSGTGTQEFQLQLLFGA